MKCFRNIFIGCLSLMIVFGTTLEVSAKDFTAVDEEAIKIEQISVYNEALEKDITYKKWNGEWAAVIDSEEELEAYLSATKSMVEETMDQAFAVAAKKSVPKAAASSSYSDDVLVRRVSGTYNFDCRCSYRVSNGKVTSATAYGTLTGFTWGVRYDEKSSSAKIINSGKTIDCFISGTITNYIIFNGVGDIYTCSVTSGGYVNI